MPDEPKPAQQPPPRHTPSDLYFLFFAGLAALMPFLALYYEGQNPGRQIRVLTAIPPLIALFATASLWGGLADELIPTPAPAGSCHGRCYRCVLALSQANSFLLLGVLIVGCAFFFAHQPLVDNSAMEDAG